MAVPKFDETFIPILDVLSDGEVLTASQLRGKVREKYFNHLSEDELHARTNSGTNLLADRISWGKTYLKIGGFISQPKRGTVQIHQAGMEVLRRGSLSLSEVKTTQAFRDHEARKADRKEKKKVDQPELNLEESQSPQDLIDRGITTIKEQVKGELLDFLMAIDPYQFESVILKLLKRMGYGDMLETKKSGDGGIDGVMNEDKLGLDRIYIQAKRYTTGKVQETDIRNFIGAMSGDTSKGVFVTTSDFAEKASIKAESAHHRIILIDGNRLAELMYEYEVGIQVKETYSVKEFDEDFFNS